MFLSDDIKLRSLSITSSLGMNVFIQDCTCNYQKLEYCDNHNQNIHKGDAFLHWTYFVYMVANKNLCKGKKYYWEKLGAIKYYTLTTRIWKHSQTSISATTPNEPEMTKTHISGTRNIPKSLRTSSVAGRQRTSSIEK